MFVSGPRPVRAGKAGLEADGGEVGGGGGGVGLRGEAARQSGAASEVAVWACGVAAAARAGAATAPGLRLFVLGALGGVAGGWEARASGVWWRFSAEPEGERMRTSGLLGAGGGGAAGAGAGAAGRGRPVPHPSSPGVLCAPPALCTFAILQASCCRRSSACSRLSACIAARAALRRVRAFAARFAPCLCSDSFLEERLTSPRPQDRVYLGGLHTIFLC